ncbi:ketopantoate reductase family protein [Sinomonas terrae]|uniref:2-dehydropantoate 2-reductase n=1 Tax=Sinomonas terrae TaxID=2908838 RepID=A0ABS9TW93_9MICC|nr:2-dehydropantoate 2-reductase [Sinomonas terrae]MCH6468650.1 2-dehydropantoate 2-reductase [Sinomonas terrae]
MKTAIVGAGAMGQLFGARLQLAGEDVTLFDTQQRTIDALNSSGISLETEKGTEHVSVKARRAEDERGPFDLFVVFTKGFHTRSAVESVQHLLGPGSVGLTLQNGLGHAKILMEFFGPEHTVAGVTDFPADLEAVGRVKSSERGSVRIGSLGPQGHADEVAQAFNRAGLNAKVESDVRIPIWEKVAFNAALNSLSAVTGKVVGDLAKSPDARALISAVLAETRSVAASEGIDLSVERVGGAVESAFANHAAHKTSMLADLEAGRPTEVDFIGGAVVETGRESGVPTPVLETLCRLVRIRTAN